VDAAASHDADNSQHRQFPQADQVKNRSPCQLDPAIAQSAHVYPHGPGSRDHFPGTEAVRDPAAGLPHGARWGGRRGTAGEVMGGRIHDPGQRAAAAAIERDHPLWVVLYGPYTRTFYAFPGFAAPPGTMAAAPAPESLLADMQALELTYCRTPRLTQP
jgi:hypothetical protein